MSDTIQHIKTIGNKLCAFIDNQSIHLSGDQDGRVESLKSEANITTPLKKEFGDEVVLHPGDNRSFGDFSIKLSDGTEHPVNIKMIQEKSTYNSASVKHLSRCLYGANIGSYNALAKKVSNDKGGSITEYYYMVYYKNSTQTTLFFSLTEVADECAIINPSNGIQFKPDMRLVERTATEKRKFIIGLFKVLAKKRAMAWIIMEASEKEDEEEEMAASTLLSLGNDCREGVVLGPDGDMPEY